MDRTTAMSDPHDRRKSDFTRRLKECEEGERRRVCVNMAPFQVVPRMWRVHGSLKSCLKSSEKSASSKPRTLRFSNDIHVLFYLTCPLVQRTGIKHAMGNLIGKIAAIRGDNCYAPTHHDKKDNSYVPNRVSVVKRKLKKVEKQLFVSE